MFLGRRFQHPQQDSILRSQFFGLGHMATYPLWHRLPTAYNAAIGRMVSRFALLEKRVNDLIYGLLELDPKMGRVAVRSPRMSDSFVMLQDLIALRGFACTADLKSLGNLCKRLEELRDRVCHGIWVKHPASKTPILQVLAGSYAETPGGASVKARINPQALSITLADFRHHLKLTDQAILALRAISRELEPQHFALLQKRLAQQAPGSSRKNPPTNQSPAKRKRQPRSYLVSGM